MRKRKAADLSEYFVNQEEIASIINKYAEVRLSIKDPEKPHHSRAICFGLLSQDWHGDRTNDALKAFRSEYFKFLTKFERETGIREITSRALWKMGNETIDINELRGEINTLIKAYEIRKGKSWIDLLKEHMLEGWGQNNQVQQETQA